MRSPKAYLSAIVTRLSIDQLRSARVRREEYLGPWLPEPLPTESAHDRIAIGESLSMAFLVLLESLNPTELAVFLLREVFDYDYDETSRLVGKGEENCRQIARRARQYVAARRPRFESSLEQEELLMGTFLEACFGGDMEGLLALLSEDVSFWSDGGGKTLAALNPIHGAEKVARFFSGILCKAPPGLTVRRASISGRPARSRRLLRRWTSPERRDLRGRGGKHPGHSPRGQPGEAQSRAAAAVRGGLGYGGIGGPGYRRDRRARPQGGGSVASYRTRSSGDESGRRTRYGQGRSGDGGEPQTGPPGSEHDSPLRHQPLQVTPD